MRSSPAATGRKPKRHWAQAPAPRLAGGGRDCDVAHAAGGLRAAAAHHLQAATCATGLQDGPRDGGEYVDSELQVRGARSEQGAIPAAAGAGAAHAGVYSSIHAGLRDSTSTKVLICRKNLPVNSPQFATLKVGIRNHAK